MANTIYGYAGKILRVNLATHSVTEENLAADSAKKYIGGAGLAASILFNETSVSTDPLGPDNRLIFMTGPFTNTIVPASSKYAVVSKSPLTGIYGEADSGGVWGVMLKRAGYDGIVFTGAAEHPVYLYVHNGRAEIRNAKHIWGKDTFETDNLLKSETSPKAVVCSIGPAGEKMVKIAAIMNDGVHARAAARCGLGAVMGSKKLKAIVVEGNMETAVFDKERLKASLKESRRRIIEKTEGLRRYGTAGAVKGIEQIGDLPIKNWQLGSWPDAEHVNGVAMAESILVKNYGCGNCVIRCGRTVHVASGKYSGQEGAGPEYETIGSFGSLCLINDLEAIAKANEICNRLGIDTISAGAAIAFAIEAAEKGFMNDFDTNNLSWGNADGVLELIKQIGYKSGLGALLGQGVRSMASRLGKGAEEFAIHVKGLEFPMHDPRAHNSLAVSYATCNRGACHLAFSHILDRTVTLPELDYVEIQDRFAAEGRGILAAKMQDLSSWFDSLKLCKFLLFGGFAIGEVIEWLECVTGWRITLDEFMLIGERIYNLKRLYNNHMGIRAGDDKLPERILQQPRGEGGAASNLPPLELMLREYYIARGWGDDGIPLPETLRRLDL